MARTPAALNEASVQVMRGRLKLVAAETRSALRAQLFANAQEVMALQRALAAAHNKTGASKGHLVRSIRTRGYDKPGFIRRRIYAGGQPTIKDVENPKSGGRSWYDYAMAMEFGTSTRDGKVRQAATPFFWPAWRLKKRSLVAKITPIVSAAVKKAATS